MPYKKVRQSGEASPRASSSNSSDDITLTELSAYAQPKKLSNLRLLLLTCPNFGLQIAWLLLMSYGTPFLHSLDLSDSIIALVWLTGPLSGALLQPIFGALSDECPHPWGKRKLFILCGASSVVLCLLALACTEDLTDDHIGKEWRPPVADGVKVEEHSHLVTQLLAIFFICTINVAIQPFQSGIRALIVDNCPSQQQVQASAWSTRWNGLGSVFIGLMGFSNTTKWAPFLGKTQFKALGVIATFSIVITAFLVCFFNVFMASVDSLRESMHNMPPITREVCKIQFAAWLGWFPILYYSSTYINQTYSEAPAAVTILSIPLAVVWKNPFIILAFCMFLTFFSWTVPVSIGIVALAGTSCAITIWIPFALISAEIAQNTRDEIPGTNEYAGEMESLRRYGGRDRTAAILGLHNMAISVPQIISALFCAFLFRSFEIIGVKNGAAWVFCCAGLAAGYAAFLTKNLVI